MISLIEPLICPCCVPALLHTLSQCSAPFLLQPFLQLKSSSLSAAIGLELRPSTEEEEDAYPSDYSNQMM